jgi:hypothetical protein
MGVGGWGPNDFLAFDPEIRFPRTVPITGNGLIGGIRLEGEGSAEPKMIRGKNKPKGKTWEYIIMVDGTPDDVDHAIGIVRSFDQTAEVQYSSVGVFISTNVEKAASVACFSVPSCKIMKQPKA